MSSMNPNQLESNRVKKIAIDAREMVGQLAGKGRYVAELIFALAQIDHQNLYYLYLKQPLPKSIKLPTNFQPVLIGGLPGLRQYWLANDAKRLGCNVLLSPTGYLPILFSQIPSVVTVHDLAIFTTPEAKAQLKTQLAEKLLLGLAARKAKHILAVSQATKDDLIKIFHLPTNKITVTHLGYDRQQYQPKENNDQAVLKNLRLIPGYILFIGTLEPRKNIEGLIKAYAQLPPSLRQQHKLVIGGKKGWYYESIFRTVKSMNLNSSVQFLGRVNDDDLPALYRQAKGFVFPSFAEGFGLPPLEAIACGTPVISANTTSLPEVIGQAGLLINPRQTPQLSKAIEQLLTDQQLYSKLKNQTLNQAEQFNWQKTAELTLEILMQTAEAK